MRSSLLEHSSNWDIQNEMAIKPESDKAIAAASIISFLWERSCYDLLFQLEQAYNGLSHFSIMLSVLRAGASPPAAGDGRGADVQWSHGPASLRFPQHDRLRQGGPHRQPLALHC